MSVHVVAVDSAVKGKDGVVEEDRKVRESAGPLGFDDDSRSGRRSGWWWWRGRPLRPDAVLLLLGIFHLSRGIERRRRRAEEGRIVLGFDMCGFWRVHGRWHIPGGCGSGGWFVVEDLQDGPGRKFDDVGGGDVLGSHEDGERGHLVVAVVAELVEDSALIGDEEGDEGTFDGA